MQIRYFSIFIFIFTFSNFAFTNNYTDSLKRKLDVAEEKEKAEIYTNIYTYYYDNDSMSLSLLFAQKALQYSQHIKNKELTAKAYSKIGYIYLYWDDNINAQKYFISTIQLNQYLKDKTPIIYSYRGLGRTYTNISNFESAIKYYNNGLKLCESENNEKEKSIFNNEIGNMYLKMERYDKALFHFTEFYKGGLHLKDSSLIIYALNNIGFINKELGNYSEAIHQFNQTLVYYSKHNLMRGIASSYNGLGEVYFAKKENKLALFYFQKSFKVSEKQGFKIYCIENQKKISEVFRKLGEADSALTHYIIFSNLRDTVLNLEKEKQIRNLESKHEIEQNEKRILDLEKESKNKGIFLYITVLTTILTLIIIVLIYHSYKLRIRLHKKEKLELDTLINQKSRELVSLLIETTHKKQMIENLEVEIDSILHDNNLKGKTLNIANQIKGKLKFSLATNDEWSIIRKQFEEIHPEFFSKLISKQKDITQLELKQCAFIKMNLSPKDVAMILNINVKSVQVARYRLKRKLNLDNDISLINFIHSI